ncbi:LysR family transcriptional regulator [Chelatococcus asaccharovorans]
MRNMNFETLDLRQLDAFAAVMSAGSITGAARLLGRSQPAVTRLIQELEANLGFALLHRNGPRITPTNRGVLFHEEVERLLVSLKHMRERALAISQDAPLAIEIAAIPALAAGLVPRALAVIDAAVMPKQVHVQSAPAERVVQSVLARSADVGFASLPLEHPGLDIQWIGEAPCVAAVSASDPLARGEVVRLADLADRRIVTMANPYRLRGRIDEALAKAGVNPSDILDTNASFTALGVARSGLGVALVEPATAYSLPIEGLAIRPLDVHIPFVFGIVTPLAKPLTPGVEALISAFDVVSAALVPRLKRLDPGGRESLADVLYGHDRRPPGEDGDRSAPGEEGTDQ